MKKRVMTICAALILLTTQLAMPLISNAEGEITAQQPVIMGDSYVYETEDCVLNGNAWVNNTFPAYSGTGYVYLTNGGFTMSIDVPYTGKYKLEVSSANDNNGGRCDLLSINGGANWLVAAPGDPVRTWVLCEPGTENWVDGALQPTPPAEGFDFVAGTNTITISANWGYCAYDRIILTPMDGVIPQQPVTVGDTYIYEAEDSVLNGSTWINNSFQTYSGTGYVYLGTGGFTINIDVPYTGKYKLEVSSANDGNGNRCDLVSINGSANWFIATSATANRTWELNQPGAENWVEGVLSPLPPEGGFDFTAGTNTVTFSHNWGYCAYDRIILTPMDEDIPVAVSLSKYESGEDDYFTVDISGWKADHSYQIWTYQEVTSGVFGTSEKHNQWILSKPYTLGSNRSADADPAFENRPIGFTESSGILQANIGTFTSGSNNYTIAVKVIDGDGNFVGQYKDTYTPAEVGQAVITKVTVDNVFADEKPIVKDIASGTPVQFVVTGNDVADKVYSAKVDQTGTELTAAGAGLNEFSWDISALAPGNYSVTLTLTSGTTSDSRTVNFKLYDSTVAASSYGVIGGAASAAPGTETDTHFAIDIDAAGITGAWFRYRISEPWGPTVRFSDPIVPSGGAISTIDSDSILKDKYGIYQVTGYTYRNDVSSADDGFVKTVNYARPGGATLDVTVTVGESPAGAGVVASNKGDLIEISASTNIPSPVYSFWRRDANGWVMIRDYAAAGTVTWQPHRVGLYTIQVRAKAADGLTYEVVKNIEFNITEVAGDAIAEVTDITINDLSAAAARTPILITANATSTSEDLLYKFIISNGYIYYVETSYSADPTYMWVPGKAGEYKISVLVKNQASFGKYDAMESFTVNAN